jgi:hypothetical protein
MAPSTVTWPTATEIGAKAGCSADTVLRAAARGQLRAVRNGKGSGVLRFDPQDAQAWIDSRRRMRK